MPTIKEKLAKLHIKKWACTFTGEHGGCSTVRFDTQEQALKFSKTVPDGAVHFDPSGYL